MKHSGSILDCLVISYIPKKLERIFRRPELVVINFFNYNFGRIDFISLELNTKKTVCFEIF